MKTPHFWSGRIDPRSREAAPLTRTLLTPLSWVYDAAGRHAQRKATPVGVTARVLCIGNLTAGGTGKTPIVRRLREYIAEGSQLRTATLSRGYGGCEKGPLKVDAGSHTARQVGDEPLMLAQTGEAWIGADRVETARAMAADGVDYILMDDGFQNPSLEKDMSILVIDSNDPFGNGHVIPKGPLREPVSRGLARADAIILTGDGPCPDEIKATGLDVYRARLRPRTKLAPRPLVAFAGIGQPQNFFAMLKQAGAPLVDAVPFADHHRYSERDLKYLRTLAETRGAGLITTEKDLARLSPGQRSGIAAYGVDIVFDRPDALLDLIIAKTLDEAV